MVDRIFKFIKGDTRLVSLLILVSLLFLFGGVQITDAALTTSFFKKNGDNIILANATHELGSSGNRILKGWFTDVDTTNITIGGASSGALDMGGFAITNGGIFTATNFISTSTSAASSIVYRLGIGTTTPNKQLVVDAGASATTTVQFGDVYSGTAATCFEVAENDGSITSFYFVGGAIVIETNACG